jgi:hypothetical protein
MGPQRCLRVEGASTRTRSLFQLTSINILGVYSFRPCETDAKQHPTLQRPTQTVIDMDAKSIVDTASSNSRSATAGAYTRPPFSST